MAAPITPRYRDPNWHYVPAEKTDISATFAAAKAELAEEERARAAAVARLAGLGLPTRSNRVRLVEAPSMRRRWP